MKNAHGFVLVYSVTSPSSFEAVNKVYESVMRVHPIPMPIALVGNKVDLKNEREISTEQGQDWAKKHNSGFFEVSAKAKLNVSETFLWCVRAIDAWRLKHPNLTPQDKSAKKPGGKKCVLF